MGKKENKIVLITGASSGIGLATAIYLINKGYIVFGTSRDPDKPDLKEIMKARYIRDHTKWKFVNEEKSEVIDNGSKIPSDILNNLSNIIDKIRLYKLDVTDVQSVDTCITKAWNDALDLGNGIDVLINNAGDGYFGSIEDMDVEVLQKQFEVNLWGQIRMIKKILPFMRERKKGQIINISSLAGIISIPFQSTYSASKSAVMLYSSSLRSELRPFNIKVSCVAPSDINSNFDVNMVKMEDSTDLGGIINKLPVDENSPYYNQAKSVWKEIVKNLIVAPPPTLIAKTIFKAIKSKKPRIIYMSGSFIQRGLMVIKRRLISNDLAIKLIEMFYGL